MFEGIYGNKTSVGLLEAMLQKRELVPRGIVLEGPSGCGKSLLAKKFLESISQSVLTVSPAKFDTVSSLEDLYSSAIIFDNCHLLSKDQWLQVSQILDAPKFLGYFVFTTPEPQKLPPIIKSRVFRIPISRLSEEDSLNYLLSLCASQQKDYQLGVLKELARRTRGVPREMNTLFQVCASLEGGITKENLERCNCSDLEDLSVKLLLSLGEYEQSFALLDRLLDTHSPREIIDQLFTTYSKAVLYKNQPVWKTIYSRYPDFHKKTNTFLNWLKAENLPGDSLYLLIKELSEEEVPDIPQKVSYYQEPSGPSTIGAKALAAAINGRIEKE